MASRPELEQTRGLDLNAGQLDHESTEACEELASDPGRDGSGGAECLVVSEIDDSNVCPAEAASGVDPDAVVDVEKEVSVGDAEGPTVANISGGTEVMHRHVSSSGATEIRESLELPQEMQNGVDDEGRKSCMIDGREVDQKPESSLVETGSTAVVDVKVTVPEEVETMLDGVKPAEFGKNNHEGKPVDEESSSVEKANIDTIIMPGNLVKDKNLMTQDEASQSLVAADESRALRDTQMNAIETAKTMVAVGLVEVKGAEANFTDTEANNVGGEKDTVLESESRGEILEEDLFHKEKEESSVIGSIGCDKLDCPRDKLHVLDSASSETEHGSSCTHKSEISEAVVECAAVNAATVTTAADMDVVERSVDSLNPVAMQVEVLEIHNQTEVNVDGQLQPGEDAAVSPFCETEKKACHNKKLEAGIVDTGCSSGRESYANLSGMEPEKLEGLADQVDVQVETMKIQEKSEPTGEYISCQENASQVVNQNSVDEHLEITKVKAVLGANALDEDCMMGTAEADPPAPLVRVEGENLREVPHQGAAQVEVVGFSSKIKPSGHCLSIAENSSLANEMASHAIDDEHLNAGVHVPGDTDQNEACISKSHVLSGKIENVVVNNRDMEPQELDGEPEACKSKNSGHQKVLQVVDPQVVDGTANNQVNIDQRDSGTTDLIVEVNIRNKDSSTEYLLHASDMITTESDAVTDTQDEKEESEDIHLFQRVTSTETEIYDLELGGQNENTDHKEYTVTAHDDSVSNLPAAVSETSVAQLVGDDKNENKDAAFPSSGLNLDKCSTDGGSVADSLNLSVEISMHKTSESCGVENVVYSGIESADNLINKDHEIESQTASSLADNKDCANVIIENASPDRDQNMLAEFNVLMEDESPTTEFYQNAKLDKISVENQKNVLLGGNIVSVDSDAGKNDGQCMMVDEQETMEDADKQTVKYVTGRLVNSVKDMDQGDCYSFPSKDEDGFSTSDLVWGKVKSHPWWPGQIFDASDASGLALKYRKKDNFLVAYFGDKTFAWCDESQLKHFEMCFSEMETQNNSDVFTGAVNDALDEVSRRIALGMTCFCFPKATTANISYQKVENAGIREGTNGYILDRCSMLSYFEPGRLIEYVKALAKFPDSETDRLSLVIANAQLKAFYKSKGYSELPSFQIDGGISDSDAEIPYSNSESTGEGTIEQSSPTFSDSISAKQKSRGFSKQNNVLEDGRKRKSMSELMEIEDSQFVNGGKTKSGTNPDFDSLSVSSSKKHKVIDYDSSDSGKGKKKRLDSLGDMDIKLPLPTFTSSFKVGECIRRVANQLTGSSSNLKLHNEPSLKKVSKDDSIFDVFVSDGFNHNVQSQSIELNLEVCSSTDEMLSQLYLIAKDPMKGHCDLSTINSFFTEFRNCCISNSDNENKHPEKAGGKRDKKRKVEAQPFLSDTTEPDHMQDSYWSDLISHNSPAKAKVESHTRSQRKKRKSSGQTSNLTLVPIMQGPERLQVGMSTPNMKQALSTDRSVISVEEKMVDECTPTALILNFNGSKPLPSETDLIRIFGRYGPLKEALTEVQPKNNRVKVVFKRRADAETAFSSAGKYSIFGPSLLSYRLRYLPSTPDSSPDTNQPDKMDALREESSNLDIPVNLHSSISNVSPDTNLQGKSEIALTDTNIIHLSAPNAGGDANLPENMDAVLTENINTDIPGGLQYHSSVSGVSLDTDLQKQSGAVVLTDSCNTGIPVDLQPSTSNASIDTDQKNKSDTVLIENDNMDIPSCHHDPSASDASLDTNLQIQDDAVLIETSVTNHPSNIHPPMSDTTLDTNLHQENETILTENNNMDIPSCHHDPSASDVSLDTNLQNQDDAILIETSITNHPSNIHPPMSDTTLDTNLHQKNETILTENDNMDIPSYLHPTPSDAFIDTNLHNQSDAILVDASITNLPSSLHPPTSDTCPDKNLHEKVSDNNDAVLTENSISNTNRQLYSSISDASILNLHGRGDAVMVEGINTDLPGNLHSSMPNASPEANLECASDEVLMESSNTDIPSSIHVETLSTVSALDASQDSKPTDKTDAELVESNNMDISAQAEEEVILDTMQVVNEELVASVAKVDGQAG
ncbi:hypothetical protein Cni_G15057 [Canna indica]|uniref:PWWP domain-containing protein n=1 Tax=Canna indica TaxID=4628 RepID=A0AAQ3KD39_9LILI|nr:hypothetical protein Cni_G15057 [Canna indica]